MIQQVEFHVEKVFCGKKRDGGVGLLVRARIVAIGESQREFLRIPGVAKSAGARC